MPLSTLSLTTRRTLRITMLCTCALIIKTNPCLALDGKVYSPQVVKGEAEIEYAGTRTFDSNKEKNNLQENQFSIGYGFTDYWKTELYLAEFERGPGQTEDFTSNELENIIQFWPTGKYWLDAGLLASYHFAAKKDSPDSAEVKLLLQKDIGRFTVLANLGGEKTFGKLSTQSDPDLSSALNVRYRWSSYLEPGIELQSDYGTWSQHNSFNQQEQYLGPIIYGRLGSGFKYEVGYFTGISSPAAKSATRLKLEYEMYF